MEGVFLSEITKGLFCDFSITIYIQNIHLIPVKSKIKGSVA